MFAGDILKIAFLNEVFHYFRSMCQKDTAVRMALKDSKLPTLVIDCLLA